MFDHIELFYNPQRKHVRNGMLSPIAFEQQQKLKLKGVQETRGYSGPSLRNPRLLVHGRAELCQINCAGLGRDHGTGITVIGLRIG